MGTGTNKLNYSLLRVPTLLGPRGIINYFLEQGTGTEDHAADVLWIWLRNPFRDPVSKDSLKGILKGILARAGPGQARARPGWGWVGAFRHFR